ncbi:hypothetical protein C2S53_010157 [Perilla frutescens var. hirtella]|uniref:Uncharacterized protein n=1 Tax=Perilla frutescens var. hirtella TaxID=608512 RepID=A0AAD4IN99_PERFH|nr:hypothetical protein C2S53_010157 [Perilla frutescens var. hirtella]
MAAEVAISSAVRLLGILLIQELKFLRGVEGEVQLLKDELNRMQSFLKDANKKQAQDYSARTWISDIRKLAQDAEDAIEMFLLNVENPRRSCTCFQNHVRHLHRIDQEIKSIQIRLDAIDKSRERYGIKDLGEAADSAWRSQVEAQRRLAPWQNDILLVGIEDDVEKLLRESILDKEKKGLSITVVEGMGGIGKSTLARTIYNHPHVIAGEFDCRAWVVVSAEFTEEETIKQIILELPGSQSEKQWLRDEMKKLEKSMKDKHYVKEKLKQMLHRQLEGKTYFIVLDDVWEKDHWESLRSAFPHEQDKTSRLMVTSRNKDVIANDNRYAHKMKHLDNEKSWELFLKLALIDKSDGECHNELESVRCKILENCKGLPLAITVVAGLLADRQSSGWEEVLNRINAHSHPGILERNTVNSILELSYDNLCPPLKSCFLCLAFFKEDATIPVKRLVHIWVGQGCIQQEGRGRAEEMGRSYLDELINRNMVQIKDLTLDGRVKNIYVHDLLREVCLRKAKEETGFEILKAKEEIPYEFSHKPRHRVVYGEDLGTWSLNQNKHLRSLFLLNASGAATVYNVYVSTPAGYWSSFQLLKILDLDGIGLRRFPYSFCALIGLKYLRIHGGFFPILKLPSWLDHLKNLEILDTQSGCVQFPNFALNMVRLLYFRGYCVGGQMKIDNWKNIETLKNIRYEDWMRCNKRLIANSHVRELGISLEGWKGCDALSKSLEKMENLVILHLIRDPSISRRLIIPDLGNLNNVTKLELNSRMTKWPVASILPPNLSHLTFKFSGLHEDPMPELGKLPKLMYLKLLEYAYKGGRMQILHDGFPCLKALFLRELYRLRAIHIEEGGMPQLKQLRIRLCPALKTEDIPEYIHISCINT